MLLQWSIFSRRRKGTSHEIELSAHVLLGHCLVDSKIRIFSARELDQLDKDELSGVHLINARQLSIRTSTLQGIYLELTLQ